MKNFLICVGFLLLCATIALAADPPTTVLFDRSLPTSNLNNAAGSNRSNVAWADYELTINPSTGYPSEYWVPGDDFTLAQPGKYDITTITVWIVGNVPAKKSPDHLTLWGGTVSTGVTQISHNYTVTSVTYIDGTTYQGSTGFSPINQVDFQVDSIVKGGEAFDFFVDQPYVPSGGGYINAFLHASNRNLSSSPPAPAGVYNDWFLWLHHKNGVTSSIDFWNSQTGAGTYCPPDNPCPGWDKPSDANVRVLGVVKH